MDALNLNLALATLFGLVSFFSPCVLPLVPVYLGYLSGATVAGADERGRVRRWHPFSHAVALVVGFAAVFIALGALGGAVGQTLNRAIPSITRVGGVMLVVFGLRVAHVQWPRRWWGVTAVVMAGLAILLSVRETPPNRLLQGLLFVAVILAGSSWSRSGHVALGGVAAFLNFFTIWEGTARLTGLAHLGGFTSGEVALAESALIWLLVAWASRTELFYMEKRLDLSPGRGQGYITSALAGVVFGAGWTPCVGPILASILALAATEQSIGRGALLLTFYSLGLGVPFLLAGLAFGELGRILPRVNRHLQTISVASGLLLAAVGVLIYTGGLQLLSTRVPQVELESWLLGVLGMGH